jgi:HSP20 family protein
MFYYNPTMREYQRMRRQMNRLFNDGMRSYIERETSYPATNIWMGEDKLILSSELPGFSPEDINISVTGDTLTLSGSRPEDKLPEGGYYHRQECGYGKFARTIQLPCVVNADKINAVFEKGVLRISMERAEEDKPRKIEVKHA